MLAGDLSTSVCTICVEHLFTREQMFHGFGNKKLFCAPVSDFNLLLDCCHIAPQGVADVHSEPLFLLNMWDGSKWVQKE
jgi:hypothetical protein